jgi:hypothetical protein
VIACNLDQKNPHSPEALELRPFNETVDEVLKTEGEILDLVRGLQTPVG